MKKLMLTLLTLSCMITMNNAWSQSKIGTSYRLKSTIQLDQCDWDGTITNENAQIPDKSIFTVVNQLESGDLVIKFWNWGGKETKQALLATTPITSTLKVNTVPDASSEAIPLIKYMESYNYYYDSAWYVRYFLISSGDLDLFCDEYQRGLEATLGAVTLPFRYRTGTKEFSKDVSLSGMGGGSFAFNNNFRTSFLIGVGLSDVTIDSTNTEGKQIESINASALTLSMGIVFQFKAVQAGIFVGVDNLSDSNKYNWNGHGKPWIGIGIGLSIYSESSNAEEGKNTK